MFTTEHSQLAQRDLRDQLASAYAAGALDVAMGLLVQTQAELIQDGADDLAAAETLAGALLETGPVAGLRPGALEATFARIAADPAGQDGYGRARTAARRAGAVIDEILHLPRAVRDVALTAIGQGGWMFGGPGLRTLELDLAGDAKAELMRIEPGWRAPRHDHSGAEFTLVMTGAFEDERGRYGVGDIAFAAPGITHRPAASPGAVCYALAVSEGPISLTGPLGLIQKFWRH